MWSPSLKCIRAIYVMSGADPPSAKTKWHLFCSASVSSLCCFTNLELINDIAEAPESVMTCVGTAPLPVITCALKSNYLPCLRIGCIASISA